MVEDLLKIILLALGGWALRTLHKIQMDQRAMKVTLVGEDGTNGLNSRVRGMAITLDRHDDHLARHDTQIALLRGRE